MPGQQAPRIVRIVLASVLATASIGVAPSWTAPVRATTVGDLCTPLPILRTTYEDLNGVPQMNPGPSEITEYHYELSPGDDIAQIVPPADFNAIAASDDVLNRLGLPPRPAMPGAALTKWTYEFTNLKGFEAHQMCVRPRSSDIDTSDNWSGVHNINRTDYRRTDAEARIPHVNRSAPLCTDADYLGEDLAIWVGLGGYGQPNGRPQLLQNGQDTHDSTNDPGMNAWWEAIDGDSDTRQVVVDTYFADEQDLVEDQTYYQTQYSRVLFNWYNVTSGRALAPVSVKLVNGIEISHYYDGSCAEFIDERSDSPAKGYTPYSLAQYSDHGWGDATTAYAGGADTAVRQLPHNAIDMIRSSNNHTLSTLKNHSFTTDEAWGMHWYQAC